MIKEVIVNIDIKEKQSRTMTIDVNSNDFAMHIQDTPQKETQNITIYGVKNFMFHKEEEK